MFELGLPFTCSCSAAHRGLSFELDAVGGDETVEDGLGGARFQDEFVQVFCVEAVGRQKPLVHRLGASCIGVGGRANALAVRTTHYDSLEWRYPDSVACKAPRMLDAMLGARR